MTDLAVNSGDAAASRLLMLLWIGVEAGLLAAIFWGRNEAGVPLAEESRPVAMLLGAASVPAALVLSLVLLLCGPRHRRSRLKWGGVALFALIVWTALEQVSAAAPRQMVVPMFFQAEWPLAIAVAPTQLLLVWWLWGVFFVFFFYRYYCRGQLSVEAADREEVRLRSSQLLGIMFLGSITAGVSRGLAKMLWDDWAEVLQSSAYIFGFGACSGLCFLFLAIALMHSLWWGYGGLSIAMFVTVAYAGGMAMAFQETISFEWTVLLLLSLTAALVHYAIFLLPLRAAGYRLYALRYEENDLGRTGQRRAAPVGPSA